MLSPSPRLSAEPPTSSTAVVPSRPSSSTSAAAVASTSPASVDPASVGTASVGSAVASGEAEPLGMILCAGKNAEHIELLELAKSGIHVATFWTKLLPKRVLERKLHEAVRLARARLAGKTDTVPKARAKRLR